MFRAPSESESWRPLGEYTPPRAEDFLHSSQDWRHGEAGQAHSAGTWLPVPQAQLHRLM